MNDDCATATILNVNTTCVSVVGNVDHATPSSVPSYACGEYTGNPNDDVWFAFTATGTEHTIHMNGNGDLDAVMELYSEDCASAPIACSDATLDGGVEHMVVPGLTPGAVYKVRVFHWYTQLAYTTTFSICVVGDIATTVNESSISDVRVLPNPASDRISISGIGAGSARVLDITGRLHWEGHMVNTTDIDVSTWPRGTYIVSMEFDRQVSTERVVLQ